MISGRNGRRRTTALNNKNMIMKKLKTSTIDALQELQRIVFEMNREMGWHSDIRTGKPLTEAEHDAMFPVRIALCHSELSEALEGWRKNKVDDHLPHRRNDVVELADTVIRIFDLAGAMRYNLAKAIAEKLEYNATRQDHQITNRKKPNGKKI